MPLLPAARSSLAAADQISYVAYGGEGRAENAGRENVKYLVVFSGVTRVGDTLGGNL